MSSDDDLPDFYYYKIVLSDDRQVLLFCRFPPPTKYVLLYYTKEYGQSAGRHAFGGASDFRGELRAKALARHRTFKDWFYPRKGKAYE